MRLLSCIKPYLVLVRIFTTFYSSDPGSYLSAQSVQLHSIQGVRIFLGKDNSRCTSMTLDHHQLAPRGI